MISYFSRAGSEHLEIRVVRVDKRDPWHWKDTRKLRTPGLAFTAFRMTDYVQDERLRVE